MPAHNSEINFKKKKNQSNSYSKAEGCAQDTQSNKDC